MPRFLPSLAGSLLLTAVAVSLSVGVGLAVALHLSVADGRVRRVPGLRREEVALLAGVSIDYYTRLERGGLAGVSAVLLNSRPAKNWFAGGLARRAAHLQRKGPGR